MPIRYDREFYVKRVGLFHWRAMFRHPNAPDDAGREWEAAFVRCWTRLGALRISQACTMHFRDGIYLAQNPDQE